MGGGDAAAATHGDRSYVEQCSGAQLTGSYDRVESTGSSGRVERQGRIDRVEWKGRTRGLTGRVE